LLVILEIPANSAEYLDNVFLIKLSSRREMEGIKRWAERMGGMGSMGNA